MKVNRQRINCFKVTLFVCLLTGVSSLVFSEVAQDSQPLPPLTHYEDYVFSFGQHDYLPLEINSGTLVFDAMGDQTFYEHTALGEVEKYHQSYYSSLSGAIKTGIIISALSLSMGKTVRLGLDALGLENMASSLPVSGFFFAGMTTAAVILHNLGLAWETYEYMMLTSEDDRRSFQSIVMTEATFSPLLVHRIYGLISDPIFYRISPLPAIEHNEIPSGHGMHDSFVKLDRALRKRRKYVELEPLGEVCPLSATNCSETQASRKLKARFYSLHDSSEAMPKEVIFKASDRLVWVEGLLLCHNSLQKPNDGIFEYASDLDDGFESGNVTDSEYCDYRKTLEPQSEYDSPLSPDWIYLLVEYLDSDTNWVIPQPENETVSESDKPGIELDGSAAEDVECPATECTTRKIDVTRDSNGCLSLNLNGAVYYLPGDLIDGRSRGQSGYCHAVLNKAEGSFALATHSAHNRWKAKTQLIIDTWIREGYVSLGLSLLGSVSAGGYFGYKNYGRQSGSTDVVPYSASHNQPLIHAPPPSMSHHSLVGTEIQASRAHPLVLLSFTRSVTPASGSTFFILQPWMDWSAGEAQEPIISEMFEENTGEGTSTTLAIADVAIESDRDDDDEVSTTPDLLDNKDINLQPVTGSDSSEGLYTDLFEEEESQEEERSVLDVSSQSSVEFPRDQLETDNTSAVESATSAYSLSYKFQQHRQREPAHFHISSDEKNSLSNKEIRRRTRELSEDAVRSTVMAYLVMTDLRCEGEIPEVLSTWEDLMERVVKPEMKRLKVDMPDKLGLKRIQQSYKTAAEHFNPEETSKRTQYTLTRMAHWMMIEYVAHRFSLQKFKNDRTEYKGRIFDDTARIAASVITINSLKQEPHYVYRRQYMLFFEELRLFSKEETERLIQHYQGHFKELRRTAYGAQNIAPFREYELKAMALKVWPQSREYIEGELENLEKIRIKKLSDLWIKGMHEHIQIFVRHGDKAYGSGTSESPVAEEQGEEALQAQNSLNDAKTLLQKGIWSHLVEQAKFRSLVKTGAGANGVFPSMVKPLEEGEFQSVVKKLKDYQEEVLKLEEFQKLLEALHDYEAGMESVLTEYGYRHMETLFNTMDEERVAGRSAQGLFDDGQMFRMRYYPEALNLLRVFKESKQSEYQYYKDMFSTADEDNAIIMNMIPQIYRELIVQYSRFKRSSYGIDLDEERLKREFEDFHAGEEEPIVEARRIKIPEEMVATAVADFIDSEDWKRYKPPLLSQGREADQGQLVACLVTTYENLKKGGAGREVAISFLGKSSVLKEFHQSILIWKFRRESQREEEIENWIEQAQMLSQEIHIKNELARKKERKKRQSGSVHVPKKRDEMSAEERMAVLKKTGTRKVEISPALMSAFSEIKSRKNWREVVLTRVERSMRTAMYSADDSTWFDHDIPSFSTEEVKELHGLAAVGWTKEDKQLAKRLKAILFEPVKTKKSDRYKIDNIPIDVRVLDSFNVLVDKRSVCKEAARVGINLYLMGLKGQGLLTDLTPDQLLEVNLEGMHAKRGELPTWYHQEVNKIADTEYGRLMRLIDKIETFYTQHYESEGPDISEVFGVIPLEDISEGKNKRQKGMFRLSRLASAKYMHNNVVPWLIEHAPVLESYDSWKNAVAMKALKAEINPSVEELQPYCNAAKRVLDSAQLEQYKMPEYHWLQVSDVMGAAQKVFKKCTGVPGN